YEVAVATPIIHTPSLHDALPISRKYNDAQLLLVGGSATDDPEGREVLAECRERAAGDPDVHVVELPPTANIEINAIQRASTVILDRKSTRLNSSHDQISYAVFCL